MDDFQTYQSNLEYVPNLNKSERAFNHSLEKFWKNSSISQGQQEEFKTYLEEFQRSLRSLSKSGKGSKGLQRN